MAVIGVVVGPEDGIDPIDPGGQQLLAQIEMNAPLYSPPAPIGDALPVEIASHDDRINCDQPALVLAGEAHEITAQLPWTSRPPTRTSRTCWRR